MPPRKLKASAVASDEKREGLRKSPRKRNVPDFNEETSSSSENTPKKAKRKSAKSNRKRKSSLLDFSDCTPSTSSQKDEEKTCAFYRVKKGADGKPIFSKSLIKYFMTVDSPEMDDLMNKRFNTSFIRERKTNRDSLKIFSEEEDNDPKWLENVPKLNFDMPEVPGTEHANVFESMPIGGVDSDEELKKLTGRSTKPGSKRRKSTRCTAFKGKPLPDHSLAVDYSSALEFESSHDDDVDDDSDDAGEIKMTAKEKKRALEAASENKNSILLSLLSAPSDKPIRSHKYGNSLVPHSQNYNLSSRKEDEMLLKKYKDVMGNRQVHVVLTRLPIDDKLIKLYNIKNLNLKFARGSHGKKKVPKVKENEDKKVKVPRLGLLKLSKKKCGNTKS